MTGEMTEAVFDNTFKKNMQARRVQTGLWSSLASNIVAEILSFAGFDWILFDTEHAPNDVATLIPQLQALKGSMTTPIVRPVWNDQLEFKRLLDIGFHNFIVPFVQTRQEAEYAVSSVRYPPHGRRGVSVGARGSCFGYASDYWHRIDEHIGLVVQVETVEAAARIGILQIPHTVRCRPRWPKLQTSAIKSGRLSGPLQLVQRTPGATSTWGISSSGSDPMPV